MRLAITGSRHFTNVAQVHAYLDAKLEEHGRLEVAHGKSKGGGVDAFVADWCWEHRNRVDEWPYPVAPDVDGRHKGAPLKRNERMIATFFPDLVVGFRSAGKSNGTDHTLHYANRIGIRTEKHDESN